MTTPNALSVQPLTILSGNQQHKNRPFSFLFQGVFEQGLNFYDLVRFGVIVCLAVNLFGMDVFTSRGAGTFIGKRLGNLGAALHYFNFFFWVPLTVLFGFMQIRRRVIRLDVLLRSWFWPISLSIFLMISVNISEVPDIADHRYQVFINLVMPCILCGLVLSDSKSMRLVRDVFLIFAAMKMMAFLLAPQGAILALKGQSLGLIDSYETRLTLENNVIKTGYQLGFMILTTILIIRSCKITKRIERWLVIGLLGFLGILLLLNGTRGAFVALAATIFLLWMQQGGKAKTGMIAIILALFLGGLGAFYLVSKLYPEVQYRYIFKFSENTSWGERLDFSLEALGATPTLVGRGVGSFGADRATEFQLVYTHNAFTEMYYEGGVVGLTLFTLTIWITFRRLWRHVKNNNDPASVFCLCGFVFFFIFTQISGYLLSNAGFWLFLFCGSACVALSVRQESK